MTPAERDSLIGSIVAELVRAIVRLLPGPTGAERARAILEEEYRAADLAVDAYAADKLGPRPT